MSTPLGPSRSTTHPYTCTPCQVAYRNVDLQKAHVKSDWHRYNLKRRIAGLSPISAEVFAEKVVEARAESTAQADKALYEKTCEFCEKKFFSENSYHNHASSKKHKARVAAGGIQRKTAPDDASSVMGSTFSLGQPLPKKQGIDDEVDSEAEEEFAEVVEGLQKASIAETRPSPVKRPSNPQAAIAAAHVTPGPSDNNDGGSGTTTPTPDDGEKSKPFVPQECFFCEYMSPTLPLNAHHMEKFHGMVIPERDYLVNMEELLKHLHEKIFKYSTCLACGKTFAGKNKTEAVVSHMNDIRHCTIPFTTEEEQLRIGKFYDFRSTYSDEEDAEDEDEEMADAETKGGAKLEARRSETLTANAREDVNEDGWETDSSATSFDSEELTSVPVDDRQRQFERLGKSSHHSHADPRHHHMADGWHSHAHKHGHGAHAVFHDEYELHLPSGKSVGHRQFNRYYRQNLHNYPTPEERAERLAIEAAGGDDMDVDGQSDASGSNEHQPRGRELILPRGHGGLVGITDQKKESVRHAVMKSRTSQQVHKKKEDYVRSKVLNNNGRYYYRYTRGG